MMNSSSSSSSSLWLTISYANIALMLLLVHHHHFGVQASMEFKVGGSQGWRQPFLNQTSIYIQWGSTNRFHVGDSLRFEYNTNNNDSVIVVDKYCFYHCNSSCSEQHLYQDGNTTIRLDKPGPAYFITGNTTHCKQGQRLLIQVISLGLAITPAPAPTPIYDSPPSIAIPPDSNSYSTAAAPSPSSTSPQPPPLLPISSLPTYLFLAAAPLLLP